MWWVARFEARLAGWCPSCILISSICLHHTTRPEVPTPAPLRTTHPPRAFTLLPSLQHMPAPLLLPLVLLPLLPLPLLPAAVCRCVR